MDQIKKPRISIYLNFSGNAEMAMNFYKQVFKVEYLGPGIRRFGEMPSDPSQPALAEDVKQMVLHAELEIIPGYVLMASDAPESMGYIIKQGNNSYIQIEPSSKIEADRLFTELSVNGKIEMPIGNTFWGAYFGSFVDQFGIRWMINYWG